MAKPIIVGNGSIKDFSHPLSDSYPEVHLQDNGAALILYINPVPPEDEGTIVVANVNERNSNLIMSALIKADGLSGIVRIKIVAPSEENDIAKNIQELLKSPAYEYQVKGMSLTAAVQNIPVEKAAKDFIVQFNPRFSITSLPTITPTSTATSSFSLRQVIRNAFLKSSPNDRPQSGVVTDASDTAVRNGPNAPTKRV